MWNYLFILVTFFYVIETCYSQETDYDDVDYYIKEEVDSAESSQVDKPYQKVENIENEANTVFHKMEDPLEPTKTKSTKTKTNLKKVAENEIDISSEIETMLNEFKYYVISTKKPKPPKKVNPCPPGEELKSDSEKNKQLKVFSNCEQITSKQLESDEIKQAKSEENNKFEPEIARSAINRAKPKRFKQIINPEETKTTKRPVIGDFYEREDFYTTEESEKTMPYTNFEQSGSHEQYEEVTKPIKYHEHLEREKYKTAEKKFTQLHKPCNNPELIEQNTNDDEEVNKPFKSHEHLKREKYKMREEKTVKIRKPCTKPEFVEKNTNYDEVSQKPCKSCEKTKRVDPNTNENRHSKSRRNNEQLDSKEQHKSAGEKHTTICKNCEKYAQVEPYISLKANRLSRHRKNNQNAKENKELVKILAAKAMESEKPKQQKHSENFAVEDFEKSEEVTPVKPRQYRAQNTINEETKPAKSSKTNDCDEDKTVEIEIRRVKLCNRKDSSEEQGKTTQHEKQSKLDEEIDNVNETKNNKSNRPKRRYNAAEDSVEQPETGKDFAEQSDRTKQSDEVNAQNVTTSNSGETKDKIEATTVGNEEVKSKTLVSYPFSVSIQKKGAHYATGALLDKNWILTVAGEFYNVRETIKLYKARLGSVNCKRGGTLAAIKLIEIHPKYVYNEPNFDVALLMVAKPMEFNDLIRPIGLSAVKTKVISAKFMTTYWSRLIVKGKVLPTTANERIKQTSLRVSTQKLIPWNWCDTLMRIGNATLDSTTLCLRPIESHHSLCTPDAGAPVVAEDGLWGITSGWTSKNCRTNPSPTVFTRISLPPVRSWLDSNMNTSLSTF